ncbi:MAG TPA: FkbM family methyltransferase [Gammaproteobacteria bacterium]
MSSLGVLPTATGAWRYARAALHAYRGETLRVAGLPARVPGPRPIRLAVVGGNIRMHRLIDALVTAGATVIDVGANIGYNAIYAAHRTGPSGRVIAVEPAPDNVAVLERNVAASGLANVRIEPVAAGRAAGMRELYLRGAVSAVNSLFPDSCYGSVSDVIRVPVARLDDLADEAALVKIDVEGAELEVLEGMPRLLRQPRVALVVEWHPGLQARAGYGADALPRWLLERGWRLAAASHFSVRPLTAPDVGALAARLLKAERPVELVARRR